MNSKPEELLRPRDAAVVLGISYASLKQWIYKGKLRTVKTAGGHHRIPQGEIDRFLYKSLGRQPAQSRATFRTISGRNQLVGRIVEVRTEGLMAQVRLFIGGQHITSIITADAVRELRLKRGDKVAALIKATEVMIIKIEKAD
jgi:molybdopterin-binding protein